MKFLYRFFLVFGLILLNLSFCLGSVGGAQGLEIDFTDPKDAQSKAVWSHVSKLSINELGLGWEKEAAGSYDVWVKSRPIGIGLSWRPTYVADVDVTIKSPLKMVSRDSGGGSFQGVGQVYARYSVDKENWSSWQALKLQNYGQSEFQGQQKYKGQLRVPNVERKEYLYLLSLYSEMDVPWKSDEAAAARWILEQDPNFFSVQIPFVGYVEFLYENQFYSGKRLVGLDAVISWSVGGKHVPPKDNTVFYKRDNQPWNFLLEEPQPEAVQRDEEIKVVEKDEDPDCHIYLQNYSFATGRMEVYLDDECIFKEHVKEAHFQPIVLKTLSKQQLSKYKVILVVYDEDRFTQEIKESTRDIVVSPGDPARIISQSAELLFK